MSTINERIKKARDSTGLSLRAFGKRIGINNGSSVMRLESGENNPSEQTIRLISTAYKINYQWLKYGEGEMLLPPDSLDEMVDEVMAGENEFAKSVFRAFAQLGDEEWQLLKRIVALIQGKEG